LNCLSFSMEKLLQRNTKDKHHVQDFINMPEPDGAWIQSGLKSDLIRSDSLRIIDLIRGMISTRQPFILPS
jgi:hypothetical protein